MLGILRKNSQSFVTKVIILLIAVVFVFWGGSANFGKSSRSAATVNGKDISLALFSREYDNALKFLQKNGSGEMPENLREQVLYQLVFRELARQGAEQIGLEVTDRAVQNQIKTILALWTNNRPFDMQDYKQLLAGQKISPTNYEAKIRNELLAQQMVTLLSSLSAVSQQEIEQVIDYLAQEIRLAWTVYKSEDYLPESVAEMDLQAWYDARKQQYRSQPERKLQYIFFSKEDALKEAGASITEETIAQYYQNNIDKYRQAEQRRARHILFAVAEGANNKEKAEKKARAEEALAKIRSGADFLQIVEQYSDDPYAKVNGGDLGLFAREQLMPVMGDIIFSLQSGQVSEVVESPTGYLVLKLEEIRPEKLQSLDELRASILSEIEEPKAAALVWDKAQTVYEEIIKLGGLNKYSEQSGTAIEQTDFFTQKTPPNKYLEDSALLEAVFDLGKGELSSIIETGKGYAICLIEDSREPAVQELAAVREQVLGDFRQEKSVELARAAAEELAKELRDTKAWPASATRKESAYIKRTQPPAELPGALVQDVFQHMATGFLSQKPLNVRNDFYVYQIVDVRKSPEGLEEAFRQVIAQQMLDERKRVMITSWNEFLLSQANIWINQNLLQ